MKMVDVRVFLASFFVNCKRAAEKGGQAVFPAGKAYEFDSFTSAILVDRCDQRNVVAGPRNGFALLVKDAHIRGRMRRCQYTYFSRHARPLLGTGCPPNATRPE